MDETQFWLVLAEMKESNKLMKAMVSELSQIKFELVNERMKREAREKKPDCENCKLGMVPCYDNRCLQTGVSGGITYKITKPLEERDPKALFDPAENDFK